MRLFALALAAFACGRVDFDPFYIVGCADGTRAAFEDENAFPNIAGCAASWSGTIDLRGPEAAMLCAPSWHVCGLAGDPSELSSRASAAECMTAGGAGSGAYVTAMQHCSKEPTDPASCEYATPFGCPPTDAICAQSVCCGPGCGTDNGCKDGVYPGTTTIHSGEGCGSVSSQSISGILCCR